MAEYELDNLLSVDVEKTSLKRLVLDRLRSAILHGHFGAAERLVERDLASRIGVGRSVVREALNHLEAEGLLEWKPNHGYVVREVGLERARAIYEVRARLQGLLVRSFVERAPDTALVKVNAAINAMEAACEDDDVHGFLAATDRLHAAFVEGAGNEVLGEMLGSLKGQLAYLRVTSRASQARRREAIREARAQFEAITRRDAEAAERLAVLHVEKAAAATLELIRTRTESLDA